MSLHKLTLIDLQRKFAAGEATAMEIMQAYSLRISQVEPKVKAAPAKYGASTVFPRRSSK